MLENWPELCPSQSSWRKRKRSQVTSLSGITLSAEGKKKSWSEGGQWLRKAKSRMSGYKLSVHKHPRIECHGWLHAMTWPQRNVFFFWISIWMQYLSSHPWPCLIPLLCSASQMHSDPERWKQEWMWWCVHTCAHTHTGTGLRVLVKSDRFSLSFCNNSPAWQHESSHALKKSNVSSLSQVNQHFL